MHCLTSYVATQTQDIHVMGSFSKWNGTEEILFNSGFY